MFCLNNFDQKPEQPLDSKGLPRLGVNFLIVFVVTADGETWQSHLHLPESFVLYRHIKKSLCFGGNLFVSVWVYDGGDLKAYSKALNASICLISWWMIFSCMSLIDWKRTSIRLTTLAPMWIQATPMHLNEIKCWLGVRIFPEDDLIHVYTVHISSIIFCLVRNFFR